MVTDFRAFCYTYIMELLSDKEQLEKLCKNNAISFLGLFGSYSRGDQTPTSDVDLLVDYSESKSMFDHVRLQRQLSELLNKQVDLVTRRSVHPYIKDYVMRDLKTAYDVKEDYA